jgi:hypothetical protein
MNWDREGARANEFVATLIFQARTNEHQNRRMKTKTIIASTILGVLCRFAPQASNAQSIQDLPPVVVKTIPESGSADIPPGEYEIKVTFSKEMTDGSWSWCSAWDDSEPTGLEKPHYEADLKTCAIKVRNGPRISDSELS